MPNSHTQSPSPLDGITVLEHGDRVAVTACGSVLAALGATVSFVAEARRFGEYVPPAHAAGKHAINASDAAAIARAIECADIVITSSDTKAAPADTRPVRQIICDITAYGTSGPMAGVAHSDALMQAATGLADTTGEPASAPILCEFPQLEGLSALYAAAGILVALAARKTTNRGQAVEIALFDCAFTTLTTFLPFHFIGKPVTRSGNRHVLSAPWNIYRAADGWLLICTGSDDQWQRLCDVIGNPTLAADPRLRTAPGRVQRREIVDGAVQQWISALSANAAAGALQARGIAAGAVVSAGDLAREPNIAQRGVYAVAGCRSAIRYFAESASLCPAQAIAGAASTWPQDQSLSGPLAGLKVIELGQYTTAPLVARNLGALGADVLKIEPPGGDATRAWPPQRDGQGYFFALSNSDKRSVCLDLRVPADRDRFIALLAQADVLVENLKPGALAKLGIGPAARRAINPRLVYCAISGFGADSAYPGRPAFDTVIQAMAGIMDLVRAGDVPQKTGISYADILGGSFALIAVLAALFGRERATACNAIDISMQDAAAWITQWRHREAGAPQAAVIRCADGYVAAATANGTEHVLRSALTSTRDALVATLRSRCVDAAPIATIAELARSPQVVARELLMTATDSAQRQWPVFANPIRLSETTPNTRRAIGPLGEANRALELPHR